MSRAVSLLLAGVMPVPTGAWACAVCVGWTDGQANSGFYWSALLLTVLPFAVLGAIGAWAWRAYRGTEREDSNRGTGA